MLRDTVADDVVAVVVLLFDATRLAHRHIAGPRVALKSQPQQALAANLVIVLSLFLV